MIASKTEIGQRVLRDRSIALSPRQRSALILFDGKRSIGDVLAAAGAAGITRDDIQRLFELNLISEHPEPPSPPVPAAATPGSAPAADPAREPAQRYAEGYRIAARLAASLGDGGLRLALALEAATCYEDLLAVAPRIHAAVGDEAFVPLRKALRDD